MLGVAFGSWEEPARVGPLSAYAESLGIGEVWLPEDLFFRGGIATATTALASTKSIGVGIGVVSALVRHPAVLAMEIASLGAIYPRRLSMGIGLGSPRWLRRLGLLPKRQLAANRECLESVRDLLSGESVELDGTSFRMDDVRLTFRPAEAVPLYLGATGPKMLALSGEIADGTVLGLASGTKYLVWAREQIGIGGARRNQGCEHRIVTYVLAGDTSRDNSARVRARKIISRLLASMGPAAHTDVYEISDELREMIERRRAASFEEIHEEVSRAMPESWLDHFAVIGEADQCAEQLQRYFDAGTDVVAIVPIPGRPAEETLRWVAEDVAPRLLSQSLAGDVTKE